MKTFQLTVLLGGLIATSAVAREFSRIEYLCADWGPAMTWSGKTNESPLFSETEEEIYFLKQVSKFTHGSTTSEGKGINIYLCKMKPDGSSKTEIKELWHNVTYPIDTQDQSTWMALNVRTRRMILSVTYAGSDLTGLWKLNLDGANLERIYSPNNLTSDVHRVNHPSWTPDGRWIVFDQRLKGQDLHQNRIARCDSDGNNMTLLTDGPDDRQPSISPDGKQIAFMRWIIKGKAHDSWLWLMDLDGSNNHPLLNPEARTNWSAQAHWGTYPAWSQDGKRIFVIGSGSTVIDTATGHRMLNRRPLLQGNPQGTCGWPHWGRLGLVGFNVGGILLTDEEFKEAKWIGSSKVVECSGDRLSCRW